MRILLISDIHANLEALDACLAAAPPHDVLVNLGDIVGYGASPNEVTERSRGLGHLFVRGNHDKAISGAEEMKDFNPIAALAALWTRDHLTAGNLDWLRSLPAGPILLEGFPDIQFVHGSPLDEDEYVVHPSDAVAPLHESSRAITFFGHTHIQGAFVGGDIDDPYYPEYQSVGQFESQCMPLKEGGRYLINPGSVGQPRDGDWRAAFALFDAEFLEVTFFRVPYDLRTAQDRIMSANLPQRLATRLAAGR